MRWTEQDLTAYRQRQRGTAPAPASETEQAFMARVVGAARAAGWLVYHPYRSDRSTPGFPDLVCVRPPTAHEPQGRLLFAELKSASGQVSSEQVTWLRALATVPGIACYLWRPTDWPAIVQTLAPQEVPHD